MITFLTWFGLICLTAIILALTYVIVISLLHTVERKFSAIIRLFRTIWRFYKSLPSGKFARSSRYYVAVYDRNQAKFTHIEAVNEEFRNEGEYKAWADEVRQRLRKRQEGYVNETDSANR